MSVGLIGIGNALMRDDGLGVKAVKKIREEYNCPSDLEIVDGGALGLDLLPIVERLEKVIFVDAINFGKEPGYVGELEDEEIQAVVFPKISVHHIGLADLISVAMLKGVTPSKICLIGMQPSSLDFYFGLEVSDIVNANMDRMIEVIIEKLRSWRIDCVKRIL